MESRQVHAFGHGKVRQWLPGDFSFPYAKKGRRIGGGGLGVIFESEKGLKPPALGMRELASWSNAVRFLAALSSYMRFVTVTC